MKRRTHNEDGYIVMVAIILMAIMMSIGLASFALVDNGSRRSRDSRERDSSFALAEGALHAQGFVLARNWPTAADPAVGDSYPDYCTSADATTKRCPNRDSLDAANSATPTAANFTGTDFGGTNTTWRTRVRDNYGALTDSFDAAHANDNLVGALGTCAKPCARDFNEDKVLWVQARGIVRGKPRNVVAKLKLEQVAENVPQTGVVAGALKVTNNGGHGGRYILDGTGSSVVVRCTPDPPNGTCTNYTSGQVTPTPIGGNPPSLMTPEQILRFRDRAISDGTWYAGCPPTDKLSGAVVFSDNCANSPNYKGDGGVACTPPDSMGTPCVNTIQTPGILIIRCGELRTTGNWTYVGVVYFVNGSDGSCAPRGNNTCSSNNSFDSSRDVIDMQGGSGIWGALVADGAACIKVGSNASPNVKFDKNAFSGAKSYGAVGLVQNTWRELPPLPAITPAT